jgi:hypothetical protein
MKDRRVLTIDQAQMLARARDYEVKVKKSLERQPHIVGQGLQP